MLCVPWDTCASVGAVSTCRTCSVSCASHSAFREHQVWVTFPDPVRIKFAQLQRLAWVLLTYHSLPKQEVETEPLNHTWPIYEVTIPWLRWAIRLYVHCWGCYNTHSNGSAWTTSQSSYVMYLQTVYCKGSCLTEQLHCFAAFWRLFSISLRMRALSHVRLEGSFISGSLFSVFLRVQKSTHVELAFSELGECNPAGSAIIVFV